MHTVSAVIPSGVNGINFVTASAKEEPFRFVYFGDPQNDLTAHVSRVFREAFRKVPEARFWLIAGDLTSEPEDSQNEEFYYAAGFAFRMIPTIMVPGNHDRGYKIVNGVYVFGQKWEENKRNRSFTILGASIHIAGKWGARIGREQLFNRLSGIYVFS